MSPSWGFRQIYKAVRECLYEKDRIRNRGVGMEFGARDQRAENSRWFTLSGGVCRAGRMVPEAEGALLIATYPKTSFPDLRET